MAKVKITVVKKRTCRDMFGDNPPVECRAPECDKLELGQEFIVGDITETPPGFCASAFTDMHRHIVHVSLGADCPWMKDKGVALLSCTDGRRPVIFKLERIDG